MTRRPVLKACQVCGKPTTGSRCPRHALPTRGRNYAANAKIVRANATICHLCGLPFTDPDDPAVADHIIPRAHGGSDELANLAAAHASCNGRRGAELGQDLPWLR